MVDLCKCRYIDLVLAPVPCSASINKSSAFHFGPVRVRILLQHYRVMADAQAPVEAAVPTAQVLVQVPPAVAANVENPQQNQASLRYNFCSFYCLVFP